MSEVPESTPRVELDRIAECSSELRGYCGLRASWRIEKTYPQGNVGVYYSCGVHLSAETKSLADGFGSQLTLTYVKEKK